MNGKTHLAGGAVAFAVLISCDIEPTPAMFGGALTGALLPDIDHFSSRISNQNIGTKTVSAVISLLFGHRGFTHTLVFTAIVSFLCYMGGIISPAYSFLMSAATGLAAGILSHLILDSFNPRGIMWFWPLTDKKIHISSIRTGSFGETVVYYMLIGIILFAGWINLSPAITRFLMGL